MDVKYNRWLRSYVGHQRILQLRACGFIRDEQGSVLLCRRADVMLWDVPGGTIEPDETPSQGLVREVEEETGLVVAPQRLIGTYGGHAFEWTYPNGDQAQIFAIFMSCEIVRGVMQDQSRENVKVGFFQPDKLPPLLPRTVRMIEDAFANRPEAFFN
ncbi:MAG: NUDIX domain-containing protein [Chloroflexaceae bacterium]